MLTIVHVVICSHLTSSTSSTSQPRHQTSAAPATLVCPHPVPILIWQLADEAEATSRVRTEERLKQAEIEQRLAQTQAQLATAVRDQQAAEAGIEAEQARVM